MAGKRFLDCVTDAEKVTQVTSIRAEVKRWVNDINAFIGAYHEWPHLWTTAFFTTVAEYATGTVTVTAASQTVTGDSTTFTSAMVGRKFRVSGEAAYYTISAYVSATEITLEQPYQGDTASGESYSIYQDEYLLRADVDQYKLLRQIENGVAL